MRTITIITLLIVAPLTIGCQETSKGDYVIPSETAIISCEAAQVTMVTASVEKMASDRMGADE